MEIEDIIISGPDFPIPPPECSLGEFLVDRLKSQPKDKVIQIDSESGQSQTTRELLQISTGLAEGLIDIGLRENDIVAFVCEDRYELYAAVLGVICAGGVAALFGPRTVYQLQHLFQSVTPKYVFSDSDTIGNVEKLIPSLGKDTQIILFDLTKETSYIKFEKLILEVEVEKYKPRPIKSPRTQLSLVVFTSGATGPSNAVGLTHFNFISQILIWEYMANAQPLYWMTTLQWTPFHRISGIRSFLISIAMGITRIFVQNPSKNALKAIHTHKPVWGNIPTSKVISLLNYSDFKMYDVNSIKLISCGKSTASQGFMDRVKKEWNKDIVVQPGYGLTELNGRVTIANPAANILSPGKLAPGVQLKVVEIDTKKSLGPNKVGELYVKSNGLMKCYVGNLDLTNEAIDDGGWFHTGDLGYYDDNEYIYIVDRIREMIKYRNMKVSPVELENLIETLPGVLEAGVVGIPNEIDLWHPMALVVKQKGSNVSAEDVLRIVKENLSDWKQLRGGVKFIDAIPRTSTGKIIRPQLKELVLPLYEKSLIISF